MNVRPNLTILIPARHEEETITKVLLKVENHVKTPHETLVVNDKNQMNDKTEAVARAFAKSHANTRVLIHKSKAGQSGFSGAILDGIMHSKANAICIVMADDCDNLEDVDLMYKKLLEGWDTVCASRYMKGGKKIGGPWIQGVFSRFLNTFLEKITNMPTSDISNAFKMYRKSSLKDIPNQSSMGVEYSMYMLLSTHFKGAKITQIPTIWRGRTQGKSKFSFVKRMPNYLRLTYWAIRQSMKHH